MDEKDKSIIFNYIPPDDAVRNLACYNGEYINPKEKLNVEIESGGWTLQSVPFIILDDQKTNIVGRSILTQIGIKLMRKKPKLFQMLSIQATEKSKPEIKQGVKDNFK